MRGLNRLFILVGGLCLLSSISAYASDGVLEINQACVVNSGCFDGDTEGFPVEIAAGGSYLLTSNLDAGQDRGIYITARAVTLDLNGFRIMGDPEGPSKDGIVVVGPGTEVEIRNGSIESFTRHGIFANVEALRLRVLDVRAMNNGISGMEIQSTGALVRGCTASFNGGNGIRVFSGALVRESIMRSNEGDGLNLSGVSGYAQNVITDNAGGDANPQVSGSGVELGLNICGTDTTCP